MASESDGNLRMRVTFFPPCQVISPAAYPPVLGTPVVLNADSLKGVEGKIRVIEVSPHLAIIASLRVMLLQKNMPKNKSGFPLKGSLYVVLLRGL